MTIPYTYVVRHKPSGKLYYGSRWAKDCHPSDLWITYFTHSRTLIPFLIEQDGIDAFEFEIRHTFNTADAARKWENKVLRRMKVLDHPEHWLNRTDNMAFIPHNPSGSRWCNNGIMNKKLSIGDQLPIGFRFGRIVPFLKANQGRKPKGKYRWTEEMKQKLSNVRKQQFVNGMIPWNKGISLRG